MTSYHLGGDFIEACNCQVICPCWVDDTPDEDFCAGVFAWTFDGGSTIDGHDVSGRHLVSATIHTSARRGGDSQTVIFVDERLDDDSAKALIKAFSGKTGGPLRDLASVNGVVVDSRRATIEITHVDGVPKGKGDWMIRVGAASAAPLVAAVGKPVDFEGTLGQGLTLQHTALSLELGCDEPVRAQSATELRMDLAVLPGAPVDVLERSAMTGRFRYDFTGGTS